MATLQRPTAGRQSRWGMCTNPQCPNYRQKIEITRGDFVCPEEECKKPLSPCAPPQQKKNFFEKNKKPIGIIAGAVLGIAAIGGGIYALTNGSGKAGGGEPSEAKVTLNHTQKTLKVGESDTLKATVTPDGTQATYVWRASNKSNAVEVSSDGIVTAREAGEGKVQVQAIVNDDTLKDVCVYTVTTESSQDRLISELSITEGDFSLKVGNTKELHYKAVPEQNGEQVAFESENSSVATVSAGVVKGVKAGKTRIVAKSSKSGKTAYVTVTVKNDEGNPVTKRPWDSYATFDGTTMTFKKRHVIPGTDKVASPGDKVTGKWVNGEVNLVRWYHDGTSEPLTHN